MFERAAVFVVTLLGLSAPEQATAQEPPPQLQPVRIVVLVDESGSLSPEDVAREREAALMIVQGEPSPKSTVSVMGFGSANASGQTAVDVVCPPTQLDTPQQRQSLADCVGRIHVRSPGEGDGTDHVTALSAALDHLDSPDAADQPKLAYLLTDGRLDVSDSPAYGNTPEARNAAARQQLPGLLTNMARAGVRLWPLGFGKVDRAQLESFATGASQDKCGARTPKPTATVVDGSADLLRAIGTASRSARCASVSEPVTGTLPEGSDTDLSVDVPAIASEGAILVYKRDERVTVSYRDPRGNTVPADGTQDGSRFSLTGQGTGTEAMHITDPTPGTWTVHLSAPPGVPTQDVAAVATFQGAVRAVIGVVPPSPRPGSTVEVAMQVRGTRGAITDPALLRGLTFMAELSGDGFPPVAPVELADSDGHGDYRGLLTVPETATGRLDFAGSVTGVGVSGDRRLWPTRISPDTAGVNAVLTLTGLDDDVTVGGSLAGSATVTNSTGQERTLRLEVADQSSGTVISADPARLRLPPAGSSTLDFTLKFDPHTTLGGNQARLRLVDESNGAVVGQLLFARNVVTPPSLFMKLLWLWTSLGLAVLVGVVWTLWRVRRARAERDVRGIKVELRRRDRVVGDVRARVRATEFRFAVHTGQDPAISTGNGANPYQVTRNRGKLALHRPGGGQVAVVSGRAVDLGDDFTLVVHDRGARTASPRSTNDPYGDSTARRPSTRNDDPYANI